jgi:cyclopropane-fatty-acyl-phospholipid synthase
MFLGAGDSLEQAQLNKLDALVAMAGITKEDHVLEIGCGWGSMAIRAVQVEFPAC